MIDNVQLWFARDKNNKIVTINDVNKENKDTYFCPLCNSEVIPRQGEINSWCFAHIDKSKCSSETMYHFWVKNKLLQKGDKFIVKSDITKEYICKDILVEETFKVGDKEYRPDLTVITECGETIYFEMNYSNEKKLEDYLDIWIELGNTVVEVDVKTLINSKSGDLLTFKARYYNGKCFNVKNGEDKVYHDTIGSYKEELIKNNEYNKEKKKEVEKLDWFWKDINKYYMDDNIERIFDIIETVLYEEYINIVFEILNKHRYEKHNLLNYYYEYKQTKIYDYLFEKCNKYFNINDVSIYLRKKYIKNYSITSKEKDCNGKALQYTFDCNLKNESLDKILLKIDLQLDNKINEYNKYILARNYVKNVNEDFKYTFDNEIHYMGYCKKVTSLEDDIEDFKHEIGNVSEFYKKINYIANDIIDCKHNFSVSIVNLQQVLLDIKSLDRKCCLKVNDTEDNIRKKISLIYTMTNKEDVMILHIKEYILEKIQMYGYKIQDIICYYNGYGNIVVKINSVLYGNRLFRIKDNLRISDMFKLDDLIEVTIKKVEDGELRIKRSEERKIKKLQKRKEIYNTHIKNRFDKIFKTNKDEILEYNLNYSSLDVIYFKVNNLKEFVVCLEESVDDLNCLDLFKNIQVLSIDKHISNVTLKNIFLGKTEFGDYILGSTDSEARQSNLVDIWYFYNIKRICDEEYSDIDILYEKTINIFYKNKFKKIKDNIKYKYLYYYDFPKIIDKMNDIKEEINKSEIEIKQIYESGFNVYKIHNKNDVIEFNMNHINKSILHELNPIINSVKQINNNTINIMLNPVYTLKNKRYELWVVDDFIRSLHEIGFYGFNNVRNEFYL